MFDMSLVGAAAVAVAACVDKGIDARLEAFTESSFDVQGHRLNCEIADSEMTILLRRLVELGSEDAESLACDIVYVEWEYETI